MLHFRNLSLLILLMVALTACQPDDDVDPLSEVAEPASSDPATWRVSEHRDDDDLITAGLGLDGLMGGMPVVADPDQPSADELRRLAVHNAWNSLSVLSPAGGFGGLMVDLDHVPGLEISAFRTLSGHRHPARVLVQLPDAFPTNQPCLIVVAASGSRSVHGGIPLAAPFMADHGCAVVHTDKGAGTDFFDYSDGHGVALSGQRSGLGEEQLGFEPDDAEVRMGASAVAMAHAHSGDHPEADWGLFVLDAVHFGLEVLNETLDGQFDPSNTRIIATGLSNGGGAVLRAAELDQEGLLDAVMALMPNITPPDVPPLYDYGTLAAIYQACTLADPDITMDMPLGNPLLVAAGQQRCQALADAELLDAAEADLARDVLRSVGFDDHALELGAANIALDLWRSVAVGYASAYLRRGAFDMPCRFQMSGSQATSAQRHAWWATHSGIGPGGGIDMLDRMVSGQDSALPGIRCLRELWAGREDESEVLREAVHATRASARLPAIPVLIAHGREDGLIPAALSARPYVEQARRQGSSLVYWEVENAQHFDALLNVPGLDRRFVPILPFGWAGLEHVRAVLDGEIDPGADRIFETTPAPAGQPLNWEHLGLR
jgi:hydroxybutyrate-dimer hydrolase